MDNAVFYYGPSLLTGEPIVAAITGLSTPTANEKTGPMLQTWILCADMKPTEAVKRGADEAICGTCALRSGTNIGRACYVVWWLGPQQVFKALDSYRLRPVNHLAREIEGQHVRLGAYGDPAAVPLEVWLQLTRHAAGWSGYTHQWKTCDERFKSLLMASVDTPRQKVEAQARGWRTFHLRRHGDVPSADEVICPASKEGDYRSTCAECQLCRGTAREAKSVAIYPHGQRTKWLPTEVVV